MKHIITKQELATFPEDVQAQALDTLKAFSEVNISFEYGRYEVSPHYCLKAQYGADHKEFGAVRATDVYTEDERTQNYIETFHDYPHWYKGPRDYIALQAKYGKPAEMY